MFYGGTGDKKPKKEQNPRLQGLDQSSLIKGQIHFLLK